MAPPMAPNEVLATVRRWSVLLASGRQELASHLVGLARSCHADSGPAWR